MKTRIPAGLLALGFTIIALWFWPGQDKRVRGASDPIPETLAAAPAPVLAPTPAPPPARARQPLDLARVPASVLPVLDTRLEFWSRMAVVHALGQELSPQELAPLHDFLRTPETGEGKTRSGEQVLKNDLLNALRQQSTPPVGLGKLLMEIAKDPDQHEVMRAYALQHLQASYAYLTDEDSPIRGTEPERAELRQTFWDALKDPSPTVIGTALLCLHRLSLDNSEFDPERISATALQAASDERGASGVRTTALQVCAERKLAPALPVALELAGRADDVPLRMSAVSALGRLGGAGQIRFLEGLAADENARLQLPARAALKQLLQRAAK
jgi:hypothetical protein